MFLDLQEKKKKNTNWKLQANWREKQFSSRNFLVVEGLVTILVVGEELPSLLQEEENERATLELSRVDGARWMISI